MNLREAFCFCAVFQWAKFPRDNMTDRSPKDKKKKKKKPQNSKRNCIHPKTQGQE